MKKWNRSLGTSKEEQGVVTPKAPKKITIINCLLGMASGKCKINKRMFNMRVHRRSDVRKALEAMGATFN